jgi:hypothetical protein
VYERWNNPAKLHDKQLRKSSVQLMFADVYVRVVTGGARRVYGELVWPDVEHQSRQVVTGWAAHLARGFTDYSLN